MSGTREDPVDLAGPDPGPADSGSDPPDSDDEDRENGGDLRIRRLASEYNSILSSVPDEPWEELHRVDASDPSTWQSVTKERFEAALVEASGCERSFSQWWYWRLLTQFIPDNVPDHTGDPAPEWEHVEHAVRRAWPRVSPEALSSFRERAERFFEQHPRAQSRRPGGA